MVRRVLAVMCLLLGLLVCSCGQKGTIEIIPETEEQAYRRGEQNMRENRYDEALSDYLKVIDKRQRNGSEAPESHLAVGQLYLRHVNDPIAAIYHLREYLRMRPNSEQAAKVEAMVSTAKKEFAKSLPGQPFSESMERTDLMDMIKSLREENIRLKKQISQGVAPRVAGQQGKTSAADRPDDPDFYTGPNQGRSNAPKDVPSTPATLPPAMPQPQPKVAQQKAQTKPAPAPAAPAKASGTTYTVQAGDNLYRISTKVYGSSAQWKKIMDANRDQVTGPQSLKVGMVLKIPPAN